MVFKSSIQSAASSADINPSPATNTGSGITATLTAGENLTFGNVCYIKSDGKIWKGDANSAGLFPVQYMALGTISADATGSFLILGFATLSSWTWTVGGRLYLSTTAGAMTQTQPAATDDCIQVLGVALSATTVLFFPSPDYLTHT